MQSLEVIHLNKTYRGNATPVLNDVTFRYRGSGAIGYLGPNGAGKTTTLKLLVGLLIPTSGQALLNGHEAAKNRKEALWDVGALIETPEPYPTQTVYEALETVGQLRGLTSEGIDSEIDRLHGELKLPHSKRRCGALSKGQRQRVVLAAALIGDPSLLLLDEPTSGLDPAERILVRAYLARLKQDHLILLVSHQVVDVAEVCDELVFLNHGRVLLKDSIEKVSARIRGRQLDIEFLRPVPPEALTGIGSDVSDVEPLSDRRYRLTFDGSEDARGRILERCQKIGPVGQFYNASLVLEEAYLDVIFSTPSN
jgi:ABC-2 type transport system ATP-binding protein